MPPVLQRDRGDARTGIGQVASRERAPGFPAPAEPALGDDARSRSAENLQATVAVCENCRLDRVGLRRVIDRPDAPPGFAEIFGRLEVNSPAGVLGAQTAQQQPIAQLHGFVFHRSDQMLPQAALFRPRLAEIAGRAQFPPLHLRVVAVLEEQQQRAFGRLKKHRVQTRIPLFGRLHTVGDFDRRGPLASDPEGHPYHHVAMSLARATEPGSDHPAAALDDGRGVTLRERRRLKEEFPFEHPLTHRWLVGEGCRAYHHGEDSPQRL